MNSDEQKQAHAADCIPSSKGYLEAQIELQGRQIEWLFNYLIQESHSAFWDSMEKEFPRK